MRIHLGMRYLCLLLALPACGALPHPSAPIVHPEGRTIVTRFDPPAGFSRPEAGEASFAAYLRGLPLKPAGASVHLYDGSLKWRQDVHAAVIDVSVGARDLQQCADAVMRLRAEHQFAQNDLGAISFHFTNGFRADFARWAKGERIQVSGTTCTWVHSRTAGGTHDHLLTYLEQVFAYAGSLSLSKELKAPADDRIRIGDVFIQGGSPGHAMIVVDVCEDAAGRQAFLLAQSYMPAQDIHVVRNARWPEHGAWFIANEGDELVTPEWTFRWSDRKCW